MDIYNIFFIAQAIIEYWFDSSHFLHLDSGQC